MRLLWRKAWRDVVLHRGRTALATLALSLALAAGGAVLVATWTVDHATEVGYRASAPVSATLRIDAVDEALLAAVRAMPGVAAARARRVVATSIAVDGVPTRAILFAYGSDGGAQIGRVVDLEGGWPPGAGEIVIERSSMALAAAARGARIAVLGRDGSVPLVVTGRVRDVALAPGWMEHVIYGFVDASTLGALAGGARYDELQFRAADERAGRDAVRALAARVAAVVRAAGRSVESVSVPPPGEHVHAAQMRSLLLTQLGFALLALVAAAVLAVVLVGATLAAEVGTVGVLKALGARPSAVALPYLGQAVLVGLFASAIGTPLAAFAGRRYGAMKLELLNFPADAVPWPFAPLAALALLGLLLPAAAAFRVVLGAARRPVAEALRAVRVEPRAHARRAPGRTLLPRSARWALDNAFRNPRRAALAIFAIALGGSVHLGAGSLREAVRGAVDLVFASQRYDLALSFEGDPARDSIERIAATVGGVISAEVWLRAQAAVVGADGLVESSFPLVGIPAGSAHFAPTLLRGGMPADGALLVNRALLRDVPGGERASALAIRAGDRVRSLAVAGVTGGAPTPVAYVTREWLGSVVPGASPMLVVTSQRRDLAGQLDLVRRLRDAYGEAGIAVSRSARPDENRRVVESHLLMVVDFLGGMALLMLAVGACALGATMALSVLERDGETAVLRAIGARHGRVFALVVLEGVVLALAAGLAAVPLSVPASLALGEAFGRVMFEVAPRPWPGGGPVVRWIGTALTVAVLAALIPAWRASRVPVARALRVVS